MLMSTMSLLLPKPLLLYNYIAVLSPLSRLSRLDSPHLHSSCPLNCYCIFLCYGYLYCFAQAISVDAACID